MGILVDRAPGMEDTLWGTSRPRGEEQNTRSLFGYCKCAIESVGPSGREITRGMGVAFNRDGWNLDFSLNLRRRLSQLSANDHDLRIALLNDIRCFGGQCTGRCE